MLASEIFENKICPVCGCTPCNCTHISNNDHLAEDWKNVAKLAAVPVIAGAAAVGGQWLDDQKPHVDIGGKQVMVINNPGWGTIPSNAMTLTGKDGKEYKVWKPSGKGTSQWLAAPVEAVKESMCAKHISPSGAETTMCPDDEDYEINYGKNSGIADFRKKQGLDVKTGRKIKEGTDPCWSGYKQIGMKDKAGKKVPNCVPEGTDIVPAANPEDTVSLDIPLLIRLLEYSREDAKTDMDLHNVAERLITLSAGGKTLSMNDYDTIIPGSSD